MSEKPLKIFNASAGSGKTYTLVQEYLRIILHSDNPLKFRSILAMTFTNKAANEMKERILDGLIELSKPTAEKSEKELEFLISTSKNLGLSPKIIEERSFKILNRILHNYSSFSVMTIDKFTHKVIRTFAKDLNISIDFDVELDMEKLRKSVTDMLFDKIGRDKDLTALMLRYANTNLSEDKSWNFSSQLLEFSKQLFKEDAYKSIELLRKLSAQDFINVHEDLIKENKIIRTKIEKNATEAFELIKSRGLTADDFHGKSRSIFGLFKRLQDGAIDKPASDTHIQNVADEKWAQATSVNAGIVEEIAPILKQYFDQIQAVYENDYPTYLLNREILKNLNNLSLLNNLLNLVEEVKADENVLLISDFYRKIAAIITEEPVPFIYERLGVRYAHFLLDEFQDTSQMQWINTIPLLHNSLASENTNLIVGDGKQAIYRWRNGEVEQFTSLPEKILNPDHIASLSEAEPLFRALGEKYTLKKNYRSASEIVTFNNAFFTKGKELLSDHLKVIYADLIQESTQPFSGYIECVLEDKMDDDEQLEYVYSTVKRAIDLNYDLKDICILTRNNKKGSAVARYLTEKGIKVISPDSLFIGKDLTVKFVVNLMASLINPTGKNHKIKTLEHFSSLILKVGPRETIEKHTDDLLAKSISKIMLEYGYQIMQPSKFHNLYEFVESLIAIFDFDLSENPFLQFLLEQIHLFEKRNNSNARDFLDWYIERGHRTSIASPDGANAVQVMTIHKSKGLQFPLVICPFFDWEIQPHKEITWIEDTENDLPAFFINLSSTIEKTELSDVYERERGKIYLDQLNLLYVSFTRPERALFICGKTGTSASVSKLWLTPFLTSAEFGKLDGSTYTYGHFDTYPKKDEELAANYPIQFHGKKMDKPVLSYKSAENWDVEEMDEKRLFGTKVHFILSEMSQFEELDEAVKRSLVKGRISADEESEIRATIERLFEDDHFANYFKSEQQINEQEFINSEGHKLIPDKIIIHSDSTLIVDFKTGHWAPSHKKQVGEYIKILRDIGYENVSGEIYYTESNEVIPI